MTEIQAMLLANQNSEEMLRVTDFARGNSFIGVYPFPLGDELDLSIVFNAFNGTWIEYYSAKKVGGKWLQAIYVTGDRYQQYKHIDSGYPTVDGYVVGWPRPTKR